MRDVIQAFAVAIAAAAGSETVTDEEIAALQTLACKVTSAPPAATPRAPKRPANQPQ